MRIRACLYGDESTARSLTRSAELPSSQPRRRSNLAATCTILQLGFFIKGMSATGFLSSGNLIAAASDVVRDMLSSIWRLFLRRDRYAQ
jgi:hypothetical protein